MRAGNVLLILIGMLSFNIAYSASAATIPVYTDEKPNVVVAPAQNTFIIKLKSNPTTGYGWYLRGYDNDIVQPVKHRYEVAADKNLIGSGGFEYWTFSIKKAGFVVPQQTTIQLVYARPWQGTEGSSQVAFQVSTASK